MRFPILLAIGAAIVASGCTSFTDSVERMNESIANARGQLTPKQEADRAHQLEEADRAAAQQRAQRDADDAAAEQAHEEHVQAQLAEARKPRPIPVQIEDQQQCIARSDALIARERQIEREVGVIDMAALRAAAADKVACQNRMNALQACQKKNGRCAADPFAASP